MSEKVGLQEGTSLYLLGQKKSSAFSKYQKLIEKFSSEGSFLTIEESLPWLACYEADSQMIQTMRPLLVFRPKAVSTIAPFVKACCQAGIPVTPRCGGTGLAGGAVASPGGIVLLTGHLKRILQLDKDKGFAVVESGVAPNQLNDALMGTKWHLPFQIPTGGTAGLAGCLSNHAKDSLGRSVQERITQVYLVDGQGEALEAPSALVCGSEGILGIITHMQIKLALNCHQKACFHLALSWPELENRWTELSQFQLLRALVWQGEGKGVIGVLEGESWRVAASRQALDRLFGSCLTHIVNLPSFYERKPLAIELSHSVPYRRLSRKVAFKVRRVGRSLQWLS
jgi:glycolate oxidase